MPGDGATEDKSLRNTNYCIGNRAIDTFDVNKNGSTTDYVCNAAIDFQRGHDHRWPSRRKSRATRTPTVPVRSPGNRPGCRRCSTVSRISNAGNTSLTKVVAYDILALRG